MEKESKKIILEQKELTPTEFYRERRGKRKLDTTPAGIYEMEQEGSAIQITSVEKKFVAELLDVNITTIGGEIYISSDQPFNTPTNSTELFNFKLVNFAKTNQEQNGNH